ncbi:MAG: phosphatase PAP2 family protein [Bacteriovoracaceae bacterium]|nr:phosphatase PAP2 family protein [Bacteriovoracaceae bacterium]
MFKPTRKLTIEVLTIFISFLFLMIFARNSGLDIKLANLFFKPELKWIYRDHFFFEDILHKKGVWLTILIFLWLIFKVFVSYFHAKKKDLEYYFLVLISSILSVLFVATLKNYSTLSCPWNLQNFGGAQPATSLINIFSANVPKGHCFPSGHASGGYCFLSLYFIYFLLTGHRIYKKLFLGLFLGFVFGLTQQIRGAHFLSHDFATIAISIIIPLITTHIYFYYNEAL